MKEILENLHLSIKSNSGFIIRKPESDIPMPIGSTYEFDIDHKESTYQNIGATIIDGILQAGMNYERTVKPRVTAFRKNYPNVKTTSDFYKLISNNRLEDIIKWTGQKVDRIRELSEFLINENVENEHQFKNWLQYSSNVDKISKLKGIKEKTIDYLRILSGDKSIIAMDVHLKEFITVYGKTSQTINYKTGQEILLKLAEKLDIEPAILDYSIWYYMSRKR